MIQKTYRLWVASLLTLCSASAAAESRDTPFWEYGSMGDAGNKESGIIGGNTKKYMRLALPETIVGAKPYTNKGGSPWGTSNVMARVSGITKTNTSVFPETRGDGFCARLDTRMESVKSTWYCRYHRTCCRIYVFWERFMNRLRVPRIRNKMLQMGIPFTERPSAIQFDYKVKMSDRENRIRATGFSKITDVPGKAGFSGCYFIATETLGRCQRQCVR